MIKCLVKTKFIDVIQQVFNTVLVNSCYLQLWKIGFLSPIFKSDDSFDPSNYRGIAVTSCFGKLFTLIINRRFTEYIESNNLIKPHQIGFRQGYRTADHVFVLNTILNSYFKNGKSVYACFVDFSKAYDTVWQNGLLYKLIKNGLSYKSISLIKSMYEDIKMAVKLPGGLTPFFESLVGLRQGCNLSPILFNIYVNDLIKELQNDDCAVQLLSIIAQSAASCMLMTCW